MTLLGIDYGTAHIGLSVGDDETRLALPLRTLSGEEPSEVLQSIADVVQERHVETIIVGNPISLSGVLGQSADDVAGFVDRLKVAVNIPVELVDERFTTEEAKKLQQSGSTIDDHTLAAMLILQTYLDQEL